MDVYPDCHVLTARKLSNYIPPEAATLQNMQCKDKSSHKSSKNLFDRSKT